MDISATCNQDSDGTMTFTVRHGATLTHEWNFESLYLQTFPIGIGAVVGLSKMGQRVTRVLLLPHAESSFKRIQPLLEQTLDLQAQRDAFTLYKALQQACASCLYACMSDK